MPDASLDLFPDIRPLSVPAGFDYRANFIDSAEESTLVSEIQNLDLAPYEFRGVEARRRVISFGYQHGYYTRHVEQTADIPPFLQTLRFKAAALAGLPVEAFEQVLVSEYKAGTPIGWHTDRHHYDRIVGVSLLSSAILRFRRYVSKCWVRLFQTLEPRSAYQLAGPARELWQHSIPPVNALRYSITFRTVRKEDGASHLAG